LPQWGRQVFNPSNLLPLVAAEWFGLGIETGKVLAACEADLLLVPRKRLQEICYLQDALPVMSNGHLALKRIPFAK
jgi:imidazolonepropionase-like amidohydrolase